MVSTPEPHSVEAIFVEAMKPHGFKKKQLNWYLDGEAILAGINLQTSNWNARKRWGVHYVNAGCFVRELDTERKYDRKQPPVYAFHVNFRAGCLLPGEYIDTIPCLNDDNEMSVDARRGEIEMLVNERLVPVVRRLATEDGIVAIYKQSLLPQHVFTGAYGRMMPWIESRL